MPASGGNAKYAIVTAVLALGVGALVLWRNASITPTPPAPAPSAAPPPPPSAEPPSAKLADIPPPPAVEAKPEAHPSPKVVYVPAGGCEAKCSGSSPPELAQALQVRGLQARRCYNEALARDSSLRGHVQLAVRIGPSGNVCSVNVASNDMGTPQVANCAANILRNAAYPSPRGGCVDYIVPLAFVPSGQ